VGQKKGYSMNPDTTTSKQNPTIFYGWKPRSSGVAAPNPGAAGGTPPAAGDGAKAPAAGEPKPAEGEGGGQPKAVDGKSKTLAQEEVNAIVAREVAKLEKKQGDAIAAALKEARERTLKALGYDDLTLTDEQIAAKKLETANATRDEKLAAVEAKLEAAEKARVIADLRTDALTLGVGEDQLNDAIALYSVYLDAQPADAAETPQTLAEWLETRPYFLNATPNTEPGAIGGTQVMPQRGGKGSQGDNEATKVLNAVLGTPATGEVKQAVVQQTVAREKWNPLAPIKR
jgi:hypothetical protein